ncbi:unnamed protein product [Trifolium pratense]|uniref:Uncharacterized protein n=1 Tax=Trifolium pratense TaxID=57577 RepID=A0ACB0MFG0_TRIPR|nr:unnamed protein product [Trifolium pratense]
MGLGHVIHSRLQLFDRMEKLIFHVCANESGRMAILIWTIWKNRNNLVWNEQRINARQVGFQAQHHWEEWHTIYAVGREMEQQAHEVTNLTWQPPLHGNLKCNVDASFLNNECACGWCIRGSNAQFILASSNILYEKLNIIEGEALAIKEAMCEIIQRGFSQVIFECDSKVVVDAIHSRNVGVSESRSIISSIQSLLLLYPNFEVKFVKRQANSTVVHTLARAVYSKTNRYIYDLIPPCIHNILNNEIH